MLAGSRWLPLAPTGRLSGVCPSMRPCALADLHRLSTLASLVRPRHDGLQSGRRSVQLARLGRRNNQAPEAPKAPEAPEVPVAPVTLLESCYQIPGADRPPPVLLEAVPRRPRTTLANPATPSHSTAPGLLGLDCWSSPADNVPPTTSRRPGRDLGFICIPTCLVPSRPILCLPLPLSLTPSHPLRPRTLLLGPAYLCPVPALADDPLPSPLGLLLQPAPYLSHLTPVPATPAAHVSPPQSLFSHSPRLYPHRIHLTATK